MSNREQVELTYILGYPDVHKSFEAAVIKRAARLCGGCFVVRGDGYWAEDGATHQDEFSGSVMVENSLCIKLTCEMHKLDMVVEAMQHSITAYAMLYKVDIDWVHVQQAPIVGRHFSVQAKQLSHMSTEDRTRSMERDILSPGTRGAR